MKDMSLFEYFESGYGLIGVRAGAVSTGLLAIYDRYKTYLEFMDQGFSSTEARKMTIEKLKCDPSTMCRTIEMFGCKDAQ